MINDECIQQLDSFLKDGFERNLFQAAIRNLSAEYHSLTFNNFAYAMRELIRHLLHRSAPDDEIRQCSWFQPDSTSKSGIIRRHRLQYMIHGGLGDYLLKKFGLDQIIEDVCDNLLLQQKTLDAFTHIGPTTFEIPQEECQKLAQECIEAVIKIISIIDQIKNAVFTKIEDTLDGHLLESTIYESIEEIEALARRASIEELYTTGFDKITILSNKVIFTVVGNANCYFEYGSRREWREGDGTVLMPSFPFQAEVSVMIEIPFGEAISVHHVGINTDSWYE
ncbi:hypothetical protein HX127_08370 [Acinetobacter sp. 256-1]|uniref:pPIWI-associating nuclease domain-containing protein n=1 Tax=Acinetobacter sp. 256-1 TaxID=2746721 RepID=UPI002574F0F7|nr:hypothetical protein [Acinetobacter sp. 256-1]MDM1757586.1 hypothetical protein [Acinetobacter sp. 256-1]